MRSSKNISSLYAANARGIKASRLAGELAKANITREDAAVMTEADWQMTAAVAGVNAPSQETIELAVGLLRSEAPVNDDPFAPWRKN